MFQRISAADAHTMMDSEEVQIADIRDVVSYDQGHICGATRVDNQNLAQFIAACDVSKPLLVCCYHGNSSQGAAQYFAEQGSHRPIAWMAAMKCGRCCIRNSARVNHVCGALNTRSCS